MRLYRPLADVLVANDGDCANNRYLAGQSNNWDEITSVTNAVYMPYRVKPMGKLIQPRSTHHTAHIGQLILSRFSYGVPVYIDEFDPAPGKGVVLTTLAGNIQHSGSNAAPVQMRVGESFMVDMARTDYVFEALNGNHMQLNLVYQHQMLEELYERWTGHSAHPLLWTHKFRFGGPGSSWSALLEYCCRCLIEMPEEAMHGTLGKHLEEMLLLHLLQQLQESVGETLGNNRPFGLAPRYVKAAEEYLHANAKSVPSRTEVAAAVGVSVRALNGAFARFRGYSPTKFLRKIRLEGARADLLAARAGTTVQQIANAWGFLFLGDFFSLGTSLNRIENTLANCHRKR